MLNLNKQRDLKITGATVSVSQNGNSVNAPVFDRQTLYASPLITITDKGYTKHYFEEGSRICSSIGSGGFKEMYYPIEELYEETPSGSNGGVVIFPNTTAGLPWNAIQKNSQYSVEYAYRRNFNVEPYINRVGDLYDVVRHYESYNGDPEPVFYYHSDHLGSASYITDETANVVQQIAYLPYGEDWVDIRSNGYFGSAYKFNGKEKDPETGYNYYGARYYTDRLSVWLSVDPMSDKYPSISGYNYCGNNPIMRVDPDGRNYDWVESKDGKIYWDNNATSQATTKNGEKYLGRNVLVATHNRDEQLNEPMNSARFDLYLESNTNGVSATIFGNTVPADVNEYGTLAEGLYSAEFGQRAKYIKRGDYDPGLLINGGKAVPTAPGSPKATMTEIFFHKGNNNREALSDSRGNPYSAGCQTGGSYKGSHKAYYQFAKNLVGFTGSYYLRGQPQQTQHQNYTIPKIDIAPLPNDNTRIVQPFKPLSR